MSLQSKTVRKSIAFDAIDLSTLTNPINGEIARDLSDNSLKIYNQAMSSWEPISGAFSIIAGENLLENTPVYVSIGASDNSRTQGRVYKLEATDDNRIEFIGFTKNSANAGEEILVQPFGKLGGFSGLSIGSPVWVSTTVAGETTQTEPTALNVWVIRLGIALSATEVLIQPDQASSAYYNSETISDYVINNNISSPTDLTGLQFDGDESRLVTLDLVVYRRTDDIELAEKITLESVFRTDLGEWSDFSQVGAFDDSEVEFTIQTTGTIGQVKYTSSNLLGANYSGKMTYSVTRLLSV